MDHPLQLKYQRNYSIIINDCDVSLFYYFDYGERYKQINMEFQHSHRFHEIMIPLSPDTTHFIEGVPYSLEEGDIVLLQPTILHRTEYPAGSPSKRLIISFWYPKDLFGMADYYLPLLSIFNAQTPIYRFPEEIRRQVLEIIDEILQLKGIDYIHIGLNDLSLGYGMKFMFQLLADGTVERLCTKFREKGIPYGFGGIASLGKGMIPAEMIIREHYRLGSTCAILSRSFCNVDKIEHLGVISSTFVNGIREIRAFEEKCQEHIGYFMDNKWELEKFVKKIIQ